MNRVCNHKKLMLCGDVESNPGPTNFKSVIEEERHFPVYTSENSSLDIQIKLNNKINLMRCARTNKRCHNVHSKVNSKFK